MCLKTTNSVVDNQVKVEDTSLPEWYLKTAGVIDARESSCSSDPALVTLAHAAYAVYYNLLFIHVRKVIAWPSIQEA